MVGRDAADYLRSSVHGCANVSALCVSFVMCVCVCGCSRTGNWFCRFCECRVQIRMDERRAIFEHFVQHRRDDLKAEKKAKLTGAKKVFTGLLRELFQRQLEDGTWDGKTSLPVFLTTLEDALEDAARYKSIQESAMAFLPTSVQEKLYEKTVGLVCLARTTALFCFCFAPNGNLFVESQVSEYKAKAEEVKSEEKDLLEFLRQKIAASKQDLAWESDEAQHFVTSFYASKGDAKPLLSKEKQRSTFRRVQGTFKPAVDMSLSKYGSEYRKEDDNERSRLHGSRHSRRSRSRGRARERDGEHGHVDRGRDQRSSRRSRSATPSRSRSRSHSRRRSRRSSSRSRHHQRRRRSSSRSSSSSSRSDRR